MESGAAARQGELWGARARDWAEVQEGQVRPLYDAVFDAVRVDQYTRLLDVGCGAGMAAEIAAERGAHVAGFDAAEGLLEVARERVPDGDFRAGDMEELPFDDDAFSVVTGFNSFQFAGDPARALREAARVAEPGAPIAVGTWGRPDQCESAVVLKASSELGPPPPPGRTPGPWALSEPGALEGFVEQAGLSAGEPVEVETIWRYPDLDTALRGLTSAGPGTAAIRESGEERVRGALAGALEPFGDGSGGYRLNNVFRFLVARSAA
jgi:SAM-dependent methyltransferase